MSERLIIRTTGQTGPGTAADLAAHTGDTSDAHDASAISVLDAAGNYTATDVEGVLVEQVTKFAARSAMPPGLLWSFLGDSITNGSSASNFAYSYSKLAVEAVGGMIARSDFIENATSGNTSALLLARLPTAVSRGPEAFVVMVGANDAGSVTPADYADNMTAIIRYLRGYGPVVVCTVTPRASSAGATVGNRINGYNTWIRLVAPTLGCEVADTALAVTDTTTGYLSASYDSGDALHPNNAGHLVMSQVVGAAMKRATRRTDKRGLLQTVLVGSADCLEADPLNARATPTTSPWYEQPGGTGTAPAYAMVADTTGTLPNGRWAEMDFTATSGGVRRLATDTTTGFSVGDKLLMTGTLQIEDVSGTWVADCAANTSGLVFQLLNQSAVSMFSLINGRSAGIPHPTVANTYDFGPFATTFTVPASTTQILLWVSCVLPTGKRAKFRVAGVGLLNLTTLGLADEFNWANLVQNFDD